MMLGVDTETTGLDRFHGCIPYLVTTCDHTNKHRVYTWGVNPKTREVLVERQDCLEIQGLLDRANKLIFHNAKFDLKMLSAIGIKVNHLWGKVEDTLFIAHMLASQEKHDLTSVIDQYLKHDISSFEDKLEECVQAARRWCRSHLKDWKLASEAIVDDDGFQLMPSTKGSNDKSGRAWMADTWLPKAVAEHNGPSWVKGTQNENWLTVTEEYADIDSSCLIPLFNVMMKEVQRRKLEKVYRERLKILPVVHRMEHYGTSYKLDTHAHMKEEFTQRQQELEAICLGIAECYHYPLELPNRGRNKSLDAFVFDVLKLPVLAWTEQDKKKVRKTDKPFIPKPRFDGDIKEEYELTLPAHSMQQAFIKCLNEKSDYDTALGYMAAYERFCIPSSNKISILHPNLNPTGTVGLRFSHNNPNSANVSKHKKTNLRKCFGPREGRVWYSCDYTNIELVVPAFEVDEKELVHIFTYPDEPPFYGSFHMVMFSALWPEKWNDALTRFGPEGAAKFCKSEYEDTEYGQTKNFDFATQYGCQEKKANATAKHPNAFRLKAERCPKIDVLANKLLREAEKNNCVHTIPDKTIDPDRGFPIQAKRSKWGKVEPTTPLCYHVSSTAAQVLNKAMVACDQRLLEWRSDGFDAHMILTIHDELVFDFPRLEHPIQRIISGGQTGADQGGLFAAQSYGTHTGGWIVKGWKTEVGPNPLLSSLGLKETDTTDYPTRTKLNVQSSDGTIRIANDFSSAGERCTINAIRENRKPYIDVSLNKPIDIGLVCDWVKKNSIRILNVAGNCESTYKGMGEFATSYVKKLLIALDPCNVKANELREIMERVSDGIGIPIRVSCERHTVSWADGEVIPKEVKK